VRLPEGFTNDCTSEIRTGVAVYLRCPILSSLQTGDGHASTMNAMTFDSFAARDQDLANAKITSDYDCGAFSVSSDSDGSVLDTGRMYCYQDTDGNAVVLATFDDEPVQLEFDGSTGDSEALHQWVLHGPGLWID
jgi:hypothetical protein